MSSKTGFIVLARPTFDVGYAAEVARSALEVAKASLGNIDGHASLATTAEEIETAARTFKNLDLDTLIVLQGSFADSTLIAGLANTVSCPLVLWAVPEPRTGGRLRLNSLCGINLAAYVLARAGAEYRWVYRRPAEPETGDELRAAAKPSHHRGETDSIGKAGTPPATEPVSLAGSVIGLIGQRPDGFEPCDYDPEQLRRLTGVVVDDIDLANLFVAGSGANESIVDDLRSKLTERMDGIDDVDPDALEKSLRIHLGLNQLADERKWNGLATRCWPECFTEFGGAACSAMSLMTSKGVPGCCEADVYGAVTSLLLQRLSDRPPFVADLVDIERKTSTAAFWHCGLAPLELAPDGYVPRATIHSNRKKPLLNEFPLRPGPVTIARLSQSQGTHRLVVGFAQIVDAPMPFSGTSGVAQLDDAESFLDVIMQNGLEHHYGIAYGDHRDALRSYAASVDIPVLDL